MQNLSSIFEKLKEAKAKKARIIHEIERTQAHLEKEKQAHGEASEKGNPKKDSKTSSKKKKKWWDEYRSFETSGGLRVVAGKSAKQNDELYAKHLAVEDLFFHADIQGAPTTILKNGKNAADSDLRETAQFGACFSSAWRTGAAAVDVYALEKSQVSKNSPNGGSAGKGAFFLSGERKWFKKTELKLKIGNLDDAPVILPFIHIKKLEKPVELMPGSFEKEEAATKLSAHLSCKKGEILALLPNGGISLSI